ncbi:uncharacterized protein LOC134820694 [Bolinopsis microptera]|uniref:uncharacterized protein LOC134820694 n=1 Tax=Bolinopsis microptera TaxID=2820187 RepID=UPI003079D7EE
MPFLYVGNLGIDYNQEDIEKDFNEYGKIREAWHWPTFGYCFFEFDSHRDADDAMKKLHGSKTAEGKRMTIQWARRPRKHLPSRATNNDKCYICNRYGHFARDCPDIAEAGPVSHRSPPRSSGRGRGRGRRSPYRGRGGYSPRRRSNSRSPRRRSRSPYSYRRSVERKSRSRSSERYNKRPQRSYSRSPLRRSPVRRSRSPVRRSRSPVRRSRS